jgi:oligoribonuclease
MHKKSGLWDHARAYGLTPFQAEIEMHDWLEAHGIRGAEEPLCGNSVHQDRAWLKASFPRVLDRFHYRNVDISTLKELCNKFDPETAATKPNKGLAHRALEDLYETIAEFRHYKNWFFNDTIHREFDL